MHVIGSLSDAALCFSVAVLGVASCFFVRKNDFQDGDKKNMKVQPKAMVMMDDDEGDDGDDDEGCNDCPGSGNDHSVDANLTSS